MSAFTPEEMEGIVKAMSQKKPSEGEKSKIPLKAPGSYGKVAQLAFSPLMGEKPRALTELSEMEKNEVEDLKAQVEVVFGKTTLTLKELAGLEPGTLLPLEDLCDDLVDIWVNGSKVARGEVVAIDDHFGVKIVTFTKN